MQPKRILISANSNAELANMSFDLFLFEKFENVSRFVFVRKTRKWLENFWNYVTWLTRILRFGKEARLNKFLFTEILKSDSFDIERIFFDVLMPKFAAYCFSKVELKAKKGFSSISRLHMFSRKRVRTNLL